MGFDADVVQADEVGGEGAARADGAAAVGQVTGPDIQIAAGSDAGGRAGGGDFELVTLDDLPDVVFLAAAAIPSVDTFDAGDFPDRRGVDASVVGVQHGPHVFNGAGGQAHVAVALQRTGAVDDAGSQCAQAVAVNAQVAQAVDVGVEVGQAVDLQGHVGTAEDQAVFVAQCTGANAQQPGTAQGALVIDALRRDIHARRRGHAATVIEQAIGMHGGFPAAGDTGVFLKIDQCGLEAQGAHAAQAAVARVLAGELDIDQAVATDQAVVAPVDPGAGETVGAE
ncbi:hypothetical protein SRABI112_01141 [Pseudomonas mediterranea]|nr:hypothetical protein SRABI112_01141 [Pseudomonas mediterranea]